MTDTPVEIGRLVREKLMARSGEERLSWVLRCLRPLVNW